eukprot:jgi/Chrpa1/5871/Chrysochromulina_OHIO_Genome00019883-RA
MEAIDPSASESSSTSDGMQDDSALREERFAGGSRMAVRDRAFAAANRRASAVAATSEASISHEFGECRPAAASCQPPPTKLASPPVPRLSVPLTLLLTWRLPEIDESSLDIWAPGEARACMQ